MTAPIIMLGLLAAPYRVLRLVQWVTGREFDLHNGAVIGLTLLFILTAIGHFTDTNSMAEMLPSWAPARIGIIEGTQAVIAAN